MCCIKIFSFPLTVQCCISAAGIGGLPCRPSLIFETALTNMTMKFTCYIPVKSHVKSVVVICFGTCTWTGPALGIVCVPHMACSLTNLSSLCNVYRNILRLSTHETKTQIQDLKCVLQFNHNFVDCRQHQTWSTFVNHGFM